MLVWGINRSNAEDSALRSRIVLMKEEEGKNDGGRQDANSREINLERASTLHHVTWPQRHCLLRPLLTPKVIKLDDAEALPARLN
jgi:hypothetical protein